jgi:hypothetical protein
MSDREGNSGGAPGSDDDLSLPKATVAKMITGERRPIFMLVPLTIPLELLPPDVVCAKETRDLVIECCVGESRRASPGVPPC